jgi:peptidoglycan/LPS O-acetylase OafA/YrhL
MQGIEAGRFYAASAIILFHLHGISGLLVPPELKFISVYFGQGVPLFFVISAFGMCVGYMGKLETSEKIRSFYLRRLFRIAPLFYVVMLAYIPFWSLTRISSPDLFNFISTALFVHNLFPQTVGGYVWGSWTIGVEMLFYFLFPMIAIVINSWWKSLCLIVLCFAIRGTWNEAFSDAPKLLFTFSNFFIAPHMQLFSAGIAAYFAWRRLRRSNHYTRYGLALLLIGCTLSTLLMVFGGWYILEVGKIVGWHFNIAVVHASWSLALACIVVGLALHPHPVAVGPARVAMGRASFGLYLWHLMILGGLRQAGIYDTINSIFQNSWAAFTAGSILTFCIVIPISMVTFRYIERPGMDLIHRLSRPSSLPTMEWLALGIKRAPTVLLTIFGNLRRVK